MENLNKLVDNYIAAWNESDTAKRLHKIQETFTDTASYADPLMSSTGHAGIDAMITAVQTQMPSHRFHKIGTVEKVNGTIRFSWHLAEPGKSATFAGTDFCVLSPDDRMAEVTGFLDATEVAL